jgi:NADPH:quinone reductase-like Zn-dependent oxidoreductase
MPCRGWEKHPDAPESRWSRALRIQSIIHTRLNWKYIHRFGILGGVSFPPNGTFTEYIIVERDQVFLTPDHLDDIHIAAWPVGGLTAWRYLKAFHYFSPTIWFITWIYLTYRAVVVNAKVQHGQNILITGIGGGVAIIAMQICLAKGANVYVTSKSLDKIRKATSLGAKGGANYKDSQLFVIMSFLNFPLPD